MSRRSNRRKSSPGSGDSNSRSRSSRGKGKVGRGKWALRILGILALSLILAGFGLYFWMQSYLHSDDFRVFIGDTVGEVMEAEAEFELFEWQGMDVRTGGLKAQSDGFLQKMNADGVQARLSLARVRRGVWEISDLRVSKLEVELATTKARAEADPESPSEIPADETSGSAKSDDGGFLSSLLPDSAELSSAEVMSMNLDLRTSTGGLTASDVAMRVDGGQSAGSYNLNLSGGEIESPWFGSPLSLLSARGKYQNGRLYINESKSEVYQRGLLTLNGELEGREFGFFGTLKGVRAEELVPEDWQKKLTGDVETKFKVQSGKRGPITRGEVKLKQGLLTGLPVLDRIAAYANTRRFRRLNLSEARLKFWREGDRLDLTEIVLASEGLVRLEGSLRIVDGRLDGRFKLGVAPGTLAHIPGAETKVFIRGDQGLLWSPLRITGTMDDPKEDLSDRMIAAAGERMFELVPETGKMALKFAHDTATELPAKAVETGTDVIREGSDVIQEGVKGVFDLLPGSSDE